MKNKKKREITRQKEKRIVKKIGREGASINKGNKYLKVTSHPQKKLTAIKMHNMKRKA